MRIFGSFRNGDINPPIPRSSCHQLEREIGRGPGVLLPPPPCDNEDILEESNLAPPSLRAPPKFPYLEEKQRKKIDR